ncbi:FecR domain-containing protein [Phenylobacterium sp.]|uniref:FecR family protein n=1 Tax=Phenylobacterium sp. TaxID=1871053 RepID=UPI0035AE91E5
MTDARANEPAEAVRREAAEWLVRVQSDAATADDWAALTGWLEASPDHLAAFEEAELVAAELDDQREALGQALAPPDAKVVALRRGPARPRRGGVVAALAAAAAALVVAPMVWRAAEGQTQVYRTAPGEVRDIALADGSHIRLNGASQISVRLGWRARHVAMGQAEASFDVAKDPGRPFLVAVGDQQVRVVGTQFNISHYDRHIVVTVRRGVVEVRQKDMGGQPIARLTRGHELRHVEGAKTSAESTTDPAIAFAWTEGRLICQDETLADIAARLSRRYATPIRVTAAAAGKRFSGVLELGDGEDAVARRLGQYLSVPVNRTQTEIILG